jgi:hypothetical protein
MNTNFCEMYAAWRGATGLSVASPSDTHPTHFGLSTAIPGRVCVFLKMCVKLTIDNEN